MSAATALPTRRDEAWRYSDLDALAALWPVAAPREIVLGAGEENAIVLIARDGGVQDFRVTLGAGATQTVHLLMLGGPLSRITFDVATQEGAHFELKAVLLAGAGETVELVTRLNHALPDATSNQTVRAIAGSGGTTSYLGQVAVARGAQKTDASQSFKAMLLDRQSTANARPELEIFADDVKCAHGASVGELDKASLFYLASRGLPPAAAKALLRAPSSRACSRISTMRRSGSASKRSRPSGWRGWHEHHPRS